MEPVNFSMSQLSWWHKNQIFPRLQWGDIFNSILISDDIFNGSSETVSFCNCDECLDNLNYFLTGKRNET